MNMTRCIVHKKSTTTQNWERSWEISQENAGSFGTHSRSETFVLKQNSSHVSIIHNLKRSRKVGKMKRKKVFYQWYTKKEREDEKIFLPSFFGSFSKCEREREAETTHTRAGWVNGKSKEECWRHKNWLCCWRWGAHHGEHRKRERAHPHRNLGMKT